MFEDMQTSKSQDKNVFLLNGSGSRGNFEIHNKDLKNFIKISPCDQTTKKLNINLKLCSQIYPQESILSKEKIATLLQTLQKIKNNRKIIKYFRILSIHFDKIEYLLTIVFAINQSEASQKSTSQISSTKKQLRKKSGLRNFISFLFWEYNKFIESSKNFHEIDGWYLLFDEKTFNMALAQDHEYEFGPHIYEPLLLRIILQKTVLKQYLPFKHLNFPFIHLVLLLKRIKKQEDLMDNQCKKIFFSMEQCQQQEFNYTLNQILAIQMESTNLRSKEKIELFLKCPFFWDENIRILQLMQFKEKFANHNSQQYDRQRKNEYLRIQYQIQLKKGSKEQERLKEFIKNFNPENFRLSGNGDRKYIPANSVEKTSQLFFIYGGIVEKEGNMDTRISKDRPIPYITTKFKSLQFQWSQKKSDHFSFPQEKDKSNEPNHLYDHIRAMRNFCSHSRITENGLTLNRQQKVHTVQSFYPTIFNFIHKWNKVIELKLINEQEYFEQPTVKQLFCKILINLFPKYLNAQAKLLRLKEIRGLDEFRKYKLEWSFKQSNCQVCNQLVKAYDIFSYFSECEDFDILFEEHKEGACQWLKSETVKLKQKKNIMAALNIQITKQGRYDKFRQYLKEKIQKKGDAFYEDIYKNSDYISKIMLYNILEKFPNILQDIRIHRYLWDKSSKVVLQKWQEKEEQNKKEKQQLQKKNIEQDQRDRNLLSNSQIKSSQIVLDIDRESKVSKKQEIKKKEVIIENHKKQEFLEKIQAKLFSEDKINISPRQVKKQSNKKEYKQKNQQKKKLTALNQQKYKIQHQTKNQKKNLERRQFGKAEEIGFKEKKGKQKYVEKSVNESNKFK